MPEGQALCQTNTPPAVPQEAQSNGHAYPGASDLELRRVGRLVVLDLYGLGITAACTPETTPEASNNRHGSSNR